MSNVCQCYNRYTACNVFKVPVTDQIRVLLFTLIETLSSKIPAYMEKKDTSTN